MLKKGLDQIQHREKAGKKNHSHRNINAELRKKKAGQEKQGMPDRKGEEQLKGTWVFQMTMQSERGGDSKRFRGNKYDRTG